MFIESEGLMSGHSSQTIYPPFLAFLVCRHTDMGGRLHSLHLQWLNHTQIFFHLFDQMSFNLGILNEFDLVNYGYSHFD